MAGLGRPAGRAHHPGQVEQGPGLHAQHVGAAASSTASAASRSASSSRPRRASTWARAAPLDLGVEVVADGQLAAEGGLLQRLVVQALGGQGPGQVGRDLRAQAPLPHPLQDAGAPAQPAHGRRRVAGQQLDLAEELAAEGGEAARPSLPAICTAASPSSRARSNSPAMACSPARVWRADISTR